MNERATSTTTTHLVAGLVVSVLVVFAGIALFTADWGVLGMDLFGLVVLIAFLANRE